MALIRVTVWLG